MTSVLRYDLINALARRAQVSFPTAAASAASLVRLGIAREVTGQRRNRRFADDRYLAILGEGTEPLEESPRREPPEKRLASRANRTPSPPPHPSG